MQDNRSSTSEARISKLALTFAETARCWLMFRYINLQIEVTSSPSVIRMIFSLKSRSWLRVNAAVRLAQGEGDACDQGAECVQTIPPRLRTRRTHAPALAVGIGVAGFTYTWRVVRGSITRVQFPEDSTTKGKLVNGTYPDGQKRKGDLHGKSQKILLSTCNQNTTVKRMMEQRRSPREDEDICGREGKPKLLEDGYSMVRRRMFKQKGKLMWDGTVLCSKWWHLRLEMMLGTCRHLPPLHVQWWQKLLVQAY